jgi:hypothetical protein
MHIQLWGIFARAKVPHKDVLLAYYLPYVVAREDFKYYRSFGTWPSPISYQRWEFVR